MPAGTHRRRMPSSGLLVVVVVLLLIAALAGAPVVHGVFTSATSTGTNTLSAAASFPDYPATVKNDGAYFYHRLAEARTSTATSTATDSSTAANKPGTHNSRTDGPATWYDFEDISGSSVSDASGNGNAGTLSGTSPAAGHPGSALSFNGTSTDYVVSAQAGVDQRSDFTVSAWVYLATGSDDQDRAIASLSGSAGAAFLLKFDDGDNKWEFEMSRSDVAVPTVDAAKSAGAPSLNAWTHLAGVYNDTSHLMTLFVNGAASATTATHTTEWAAAGSALQTGRTKDNNAWAAFWKGRIDDVRVYQSVVTATDILGMAIEVPTIYYDFDEGSGSTASDGSGAGNTGTYNAPSNAPGWNATGRYGSAITLDGIDDYLESASRAVLTNQAFTVSAWAYLPTAAAGATHIIASENGASAAAFELKYNYNGGSPKWEMAMWPSDDYTTGATGVKSTAAPTKDAWQMITGVYDDAAGLMRLYVNGVADTTASKSSSGWTSTNPLQVGRSRYSGFGSYYQGSIDEVRTWQTALTATQISQLFSYGRTVPTGMTAAGTGALQGPISPANPAMAFNGSGSDYNQGQLTNPTTFTLECWFKASDNSGGQIAAFNANQTSFSPTFNTDRLIYIDSANNLVFGVNKAGTLVTASTAGTAASWKNWHYVAATMSPANGIRLYLDGALAASNTAGTAAGNYAGYWRWGGGHLTGWPNRPTHDYFVGMIDEVAYYSSELTAVQVSRHFNANR